MYMEAAGSVYAEKAPGLAAGPAWLGAVCLRVGPCVGMAGRVCLRLGRVCLRLGRGVVRGWPLHLSVVVGAPAVVPAAEGACAER